MFWSGYLNPLLVNDESLAYEVFEERQTCSRNLFAHVLKYFQTFEIRYFKRFNSRTFRPSETCLKVCVHILFTLQIESIGIIEKHFGKNTCRRKPVYLK
jgi:hypothetical protein